MDTQDEPIANSADRDRAAPEAPIDRSGPGPRSVLGTVLLGLSGPLITGVVAALFLMAVARFLPGAPSGGSSPAWAMRTALGMSAVLLLQNGLLVAWAWKLARSHASEPGRWLRLMPARFTAFELLLFGLVAAGVAAAGGLGAWISHELGVPADLSTVRRFEEMFRSGPGATWLLLVIAMGLGPGLGEEVWFRGIILRSLQTRFQPRWAIVISASLFALIHFDPLHIVFALPFGLVFGWLAFRTQSILPGIFCHAIVNSGVNLVRAVMIRRGEGSLVSEDMVLKPHEIASTVALIVCGVIALILVHRRYQARPVADPMDELPALIKET